MACHFSEWCAFFNFDRMELQKFFENIPPAKMAKVRNKMQEASTRDKKRLMKKVIEIEKIVNDLGFSISLIERLDGD